MAIPDLDSDGFLPSGIHDCSIEDIDERFGRFQRSEQRIRLCKKLKDFLNDLRSTGLARWLIVDGSFVSKKDEPEDVDLIVVLKIHHDFAAELRPFEYNVLSKRRVRRRYGFDVLVARENSAEYKQYTLFFQQIRGIENRRKGILRVSI